MVTITTRSDGIELIHTNVIIPRRLRDRAKSQGLSCSKILKDALEQKLKVGNDGS